LSVGEKRKVAVATIFAIDPEVLILDEPTAGLDPLTVRHIIDLIIRANQKGKTLSPQRTICMLPVRLPTRFMFLIKTKRSFGQERAGIF